MKRLRLSATITAILGVFSVFALVSLYLALADIADTGTSTTLEWYVAGISIIILSAFTISVFITLAYLLKTSARLLNLTTDTGINK
jgi:hypothetical protein